MSLSAVLRGTAITQSTLFVEPATDPALLRILAAAGLPATGRFILKAGWVSRAWSGEALPITKEQALPKLTGAKLKCSFDDATGSDTAKTLGCSDETFKTNADSYYSAAANLQLTDAGAGINNILVQGKAGKFADDIKAAKHLLPELSVLGDTKSVPAIQDWATKHLDGLPHAAYVGKWLVEIAGNDHESSMTGMEFDVNASEEDPALGYDPSKTGTY